LMRTAVATKRAARTRRWAMRLVVASMRKDCSGPPAAGTTLAKSVMEKRGKLVTTSVFAPVSLAPLRAVTVSQGSSPGVSVISSKANPSSSAP